MTEPSPKPPVDYAAIGDTAVSGIKALAPADKSWIAAVVLIVLTLEVGSYLEEAKRTESFAKVLQGAENNRADEMRSSAATINTLSTQLGHTTQQMSEILDRLGQVQARQQDIIAIQNEHENLFRQSRDRRSDP